MDLYFEDEDYRDFRIPTIPTAPPAPRPLTTNTSVQQQVSSEKKRVDWKTRAIEEEKKKDLMNGFLSRVIAVVENIRASDLELNAVQGLLEFLETEVMDGGDKASLLQRVSTAQTILQKHTTGTNAPGMDLFAFLH